MTDLRQTNGRKSPYTKAARSPMELLVILLALLTITPAMAFDGGEIHTDERDTITTNANEQDETLPSYSDYHSSCFETQMKIWGDAAELMGDLAMAHCYCEYSKLEELGIFNWENREAAYNECAHESASNKEEAFIWWALPLHRQRLESQQNK